VSWFVGRTWNNNIKWCNELPKLLSNFYIILFKYFKNMVVSHVIKPGRTDAALA